MTSSLDHQALSIFRVQGGIITAAQARNIGFSQRQIRYRVVQEGWEELRRGVYRHALFEPTHEMWLRAVTIDGVGFASHRYAARLHGLEPFDRAPVEATVRRKSLTRTPSIRVHESTQTATADVVMVDGVPVSGVERTIMDVAAVDRRQWAILAAMDSAVLAGKTDAERLDRCLKLHARQGRDGTVRFRKALELFSVGGARPIGHASRRGADILRGAGLDYPTFEDRVFVAGEFVAQTDVAWELPIIGFFDGFTHHAMKRHQTNRDRQQRQRLRQAGLLVLEFTNDQLYDPGYVIDTARSALRQARIMYRQNPHRYRNWAVRRHLD